MKVSRWVGISLAVGLFSFTAQAAMHWTPAPAKHGHGGHERHAAKAFVLSEGAGAELLLITPKLNPMPLQAEQGRVTIKSTGMDNYHALVATRDHGGMHESAIRYIYMNGKPSGESPSELMAYEKSVLEIEPAPYAREHWRYYSNTDAVFVLRFKGKALANTTVSFNTLNGTSEQLQSDGEGKLIVSLPEDFSVIKAGRMGNRPSEFMLSVSHNAGGDSFITTFSSDYHINPEHWQSTPLGLFTVLGGMALGGLITVRASRRRKEK